jgi:GAF domain-containing protein
MHVPRERELARAIAEFADTLSDDFDATGFVQRLADTCVELVDVAVATVMLADDRGTLRFVASSSAEPCVREMFERAEAGDERAPGIDAFGSASVAGGALDGPIAASCPEFVRRARAAGFVAAWAVPMRLRAQVIGVVTLLCTTPESLGAQELMIVHSFADVATIGLLHHRMIGRLRTRNEQLEPALESRIVIEQAKGIVAEHAHVNVEVAFGLIRGYARNNNRVLAELCREIVEGVFPPRALIAVARDRQA